MSYRIAGIDVHKRCWRKFSPMSKLKVSSSLSGKCLRQPRTIALAGCVVARARGRGSGYGINGAILETRVGSTGKVLEADPHEAGRIKRRSGTLHLAQAQSNRGRRGRKKDFVDAERLVKRLVARELTLSFVPDAEQRLWRAVTRKKYQLRRDVSGYTTNWSHFWKRPILSCPA